MTKNKKYLLFPLLKAIINLSTFYDKIDYFYIMKQLFTNLGLSEKERQSFLKLLEFGAQPVSIIAKQLDTPRSTMYLILEKLTKTGLVEEFERSGVKYFKCIPVKNIKDVLLTQESKIHQILEILEDSLPELEALENKLSITPKIKFYEGKDAVMKMYKEVLKENKWDAIFNPKLVKNVIPEYHYQIPDTLKANKGTAREIMVASKEADEYKKLYKSNIHQIKIFPKKLKVNSDTIICKEKIYMVSYRESEISGTEIFNPSLADTQRIIFEEVWGKY